jgi:UDP-N-acetylglucosamine acyltransferase
MKTVGAKPVCLGVNSIGMRRKGFSPETIKIIEGAMRILLRSGLNTADAVETMRTDYPGVAEVEQIIDFVSSSQKGLIKALPGRRGGRGGR